MSLTLPVGRHATKGRRVAAWPRGAAGPPQGFSNLKDVLRAYGGGNIFGEAYGSGPVQVLWLHGWARSRADFAMAAAMLAAEGVASVAVDLPGFGSSPEPERAGGAVFYAELLGEVLGDVSPDPLVLVGHSFGGRIATVLAARQPDMVKALVVTGAPLVSLGTSRRSPWAFRAVRAAHQRGFVSEARMEGARQKYGSSDYRRASGRVREVLVATLKENYEEYLGQVRAPVVLVWGTRDDQVPVEVARRARTLLVSSSHVECDVLEDTGHLVPTERPAALMAHAQRLATTP